MKDMLLRCWNWVKAVLLGLFRRDKHVAARAVQTYPRYRYPNMPKRQPCPNGHGWKRRISKTLGGARYKCNKCRVFFVRR